MRARRHVMAGVVVAVGILLAAACGPSDDSSEEPAGTAETATAAVPGPGDTVDYVEVLDVTGHGFALVRSDAGDGLYVGALVRNETPDVVIDETVEFDLLDAGGAVLGQAEPVTVSVTPGGVGAAGTTATPADCRCTLTGVAGVRARALGDSGRLGPGDAGIPVFREARITTGAGGTLAISGTLDNSRGPDLEPVDTATFVVSDAAGTVLGGGYTRIGVDVPAGKSAAVTLVPPASFGESLARPPATVAVSID